MARQVLPIVGAVVGAYFGNPQLGYAIGSLVGNAVDPEVIQGPKIGDAGVQTSSEGVPRPVVFGTAPVVGNVIMRGNRQIRKVEEGGKGGPVTESERVSWTFAIRIAEGPIKGILRIWEEEKLVYDVTPGSTIPVESAKYANKFRLYTGNESQLPDPDLEVIRGAGNVSAYRGTAYIVFPNFDLTDYRERIPTLRIEVVGTGPITPPVQVGKWLFGPVVDEGDSQLFYRTCDDVADWSGSQLHALPEWMSSLSRVSVANGDVVFFHSGNGVNAGVSYDKGVTIEQCDSELYGAEDVTWNGRYYYNRGKRSANGKNWESIPNLPSTPDETFARPNDGVVVCAFQSPDRVLITFDDGDSWITKTMPFRVESFSSNAGRIHATRSDAVACYTDNLFTTVTDAVAPSAGYTPYVGTPGRVVRKSFSGRVIFSEDGGETYSLVLSGLTLGSRTDKTVEWSEDVSRWAIASITPGSPHRWDIHYSGSGTSWTTSMTPLYGNGGNIVYIGGGVGPGDSDAVPLSSIVSALHARVKQPASKYDVSELTDMVDGVVFAGDYTVADGIRSLLTPYFADASEYDAGSGWKIHYIKRGKPVVKTLTEDDLVDEPEKSMRESAIEFPAKLHMFFQNPLIGYAPAKATSFRSSPDVRVVGEASVQVPVTIDDVDEAAKIANKLHKVSWAEAEGDTVLTVSDEHLDLVAGDNVGLALRGSVRRLRITKIEDNPGTRKITFRVDRQSAYTSNVTGIPLPAPTPPPPSIVGQTVFEFLDIPALLDTDDALVYYDAAGGTTEAWFGASVQRQDAIGDFYEVNRFNRGSAIGVLLADVADASEHYTDTTNVLRVKFYRDPELDSLTDAQFLSEAGALAVEKPDGTWELMQYRDAEQDSEGDYALTTLHRGRLNSGTSEHMQGARVVVLATVQKVPAVTAMIGTDLTHRAVSFGESPENAAEYTDAYTALSQTEWPVANLLLARDGDDVIATAVPRHRFGTEDNPVRSINWTGYRWIATDGANTVTRDTTADATTFDATGWASPVTVTVSQINRFTGEGPAVSEEIA